MSKGNVYLIRVFNEGESFYKIGITVHRYCRFYEIMKSGYSIEIVYMAMGFDYSKALKAESHLHSLFKRYNPIVKFGGYRECFVVVDVNIFSKELFKIAGEAVEYVKKLHITWR